MKIISRVLQVVTTAMTMDIVTSREPINSYKRRTSQRSYVNVHIIKEPYTKLFLSIISKKNQRINSRQVHGVLKKRCQTAYIVSFIKDSYNTLFVSQKKKYNKAWTHGTSKKTMTMCISLGTPIPEFYLFVSWKTKHYSPKYMPSLILCIVFFSKSLTKYFNTWMYKKLVRKIDIVFIKIVDFLTQSTAKYIVKYCFIKSYPPL